MKILFLTTHLNPGGITSYLAILCSQFTAKGHQVYVVSSGGELEKEFESKGVKVINMGIRTKSELSWKIYSAVGPLVRLIKDEGIDVIHAQTRVTQVLGSILKRRTRVLYISTCHGFFKTRLSRKVFPCWGDYVIAISPAVQEHLTQDFKVSPEKVVFIQHGLDVAQFPYVTDEMRERFRQKYDFNGQPIVGIIARLSDVKGHDFLIHAMQDVLKAVPNARLLIVGEGKTEAQLKEMVENLSLQDHVKFFPTMNKTMDFLPLFDVFVMPSLQEGLGLSVMEAQACGLPVVASRIGGLPHLIKDGQTGLLFESKNVQELAKAIIRVLQDKVLARQLGIQAREVIESEFSQEKMIEETLGVYQKANE